VLAAPSAVQAGPPTIRVGDDAQFEAAVASLRNSAGTIVLSRHSYGDLVVPPRSPRPLRIIGSPGVRVHRMLFDRTRRVSLGGVRVSPVWQDAWIRVSASSDVDLHDLVVTAQGTPYSASVVVPDSRRVTLRRSILTHCGDRSPGWANCLLLSRWADDVTVEDNWFHDCYGCDFVHGRFGSGLTIRSNRFERALPCNLGPVRCGHQDLIEMFAGQHLLVEGNRFGVYERGGAQLYLTNAIDHVIVVNNVFVGTDPRVPGYRSRIGVIIGSSGSRRLPHDVRVVNNTILTGVRRNDGYRGSIRMASRYGGLPRNQRPIIANNVIGVLESAWPVCPTARVSVSNVVMRGRVCSASDRLGPAKLDSLGRPTAGSTLLIDRGDPRYAPATDITGRRRKAPDIGAYEYGGRPVPGTRPGTGRRA
jgi:hypothetical protein